MIKNVKGNLVTAKLEALVNPVNCVGVMGTGLALQFKTQFPGNYLQYKDACAAKQVKLGKMFVTRTTKMWPSYIINFPTKQHWIDVSKLEDIEAGLESLVLEVLQRDIRSIAIPMLGCGMGKMDWRVVKPKIEELFNTRAPHVEAHLYVPHTRTLTGGKK
jgi:O-acetyl-ADP-ribose deacetylase (regulator of RNase III)